MRYPVSYGSSHIQAVAFTDEGVDASTILTYSQSSDPTSAHQDDQTRLWSDEQWVDVAFTEEEIAADLVSSKVVTNAAGAAPVDVPAGPPSSPPGRPDLPLPTTGGGLGLLGVLALAGGAGLRRGRARR